MSSNTRLIGVSEAAKQMGILPPHAHEIFQREGIERFQIGDGYRPKLYIRQTDFERLSEGESWRRYQGPAGRTKAINGGGEES